MKFIRASGEEPFNRIVLSQDILNNLDYFDEFIGTYKEFVAARKGNVKTANWENGERLTVSANLHNYLHVILAADGGMGHESKLNTTANALETAIAEIKSRPIPADPERAERMKSMQDKQISELYNDSRFKQFIHVYLLNSAGKLTNLLKQTEPNLPDPEGVVDQAISKYVNAFRGEGDSVAVDSPALRSLQKWDPKGGNPLLKYLSDGLMGTLRNEIKSSKQRSQGGVSTDAELSGGAGDAGKNSVGDMIASPNNPTAFSDDRIEVAHNIKQKFIQQRKALEAKIETLDPMSSEYSQSKKMLAWIDSDVLKHVSNLVMLADELHDLYQYRLDNPSPEIAKEISDLEAEFDDGRDRLDNISLAQEKSTEDETQKAEQKTTSEFFAKKTQQHWLAVNKKRQEMGQPLLPWNTKRVNPPDAQDFAAFGLDPSILELGDNSDLIRKTRGRPRKDGDSQFTPPSARRQVDEKTRLINLNDMHKHTEDILPHAFTSWHYPNREHLNPNPIWKPFPGLHNPVQKPEDIAALQSGQLDNPELQWTYLATKAGIQSNNDYAFDRLNKVKGVESLPDEERTDKLAKWTRFQQYVRNSDFYQANPEFFEAKMKEFSTPAELKRNLSVPQYFSDTFGRQMDVYLRAAAYEKGRKEIGGDKPWNKLSPDELDAIAKSVWERLYQDGNRQFSSIRADDPRFKPTSPLNRNTDPKELLMRIRSELHRISTKQKGTWVTTAIGDQLDSKSKDGTSKSNKAQGKEVPKYNRGGEALQKLEIDPNAIADHNLRFEHIPSRLMTEVPRQPSVHDLAPVEISQETPKELVSISTTKLVRMADIYDSIGMTEVADEIDKEITRRLND